MLQETSRQPGQWVRAQARVHERRVWMLLGLVSALGALVVAAYADERRAWLALVGIALLCFLRRVTHGSIVVASHWDRGARSEEAVGKRSTSWSPTASRSTTTSGRSSRATSTTS